MPVSGLYLANQVRRVLNAWIRPYVPTVTSQLLPAFADLGSRADMAAQEEYDRLASQPAPPDFDGDLSVLAEAAQAHGQAYYNTMFGLRQSSVALYCVGLFHLVEQQLFELCHDGAFTVKPPRDSKLSEVAAWFSQNFGLELPSQPGWKDVDELRLLANTVKHGEGSSANKLRTYRPALFDDPALNVLPEEVRRFGGSSRLRAPLAGQDVYPSAEDLDRYGAAAVELLESVQSHFERNAASLYFADA